MGIEKITYQVRKTVATRSNSRAQILVTCSNTREHEESLPYNLSGLGGKVLASCIPSYMMKQKFSAKGNVVYMKIIEIMWLLDCLCRIYMVISAR